MEALAELELWDGRLVSDFDHVTRQAVRLLDVPVAYVALVDSEMQYVKSCIGLPVPSGGDRTVPLDQSFCQFPVRRAEPVAFDDLREAVDLSELPVLEELGLRAYAGAPVMVEGLGPVGTVCVADEEPRAWSERDLEALGDFAESVASEIDLRREIAVRRGVEADLAAREAEFRSLVEQASDVITVLDPGGAVRYESPSLERVLGWSPEELVGQEVLEYVHPEDRERVGAAMAEALEDGGSVVFEEFRFRHADGSWRWLAANARRLPEAASWEGILAVSRDVTERRRLTDRLRVLERAVESLAEGVVVTDAELDPPGPAITYVNPAMTRLTGYSAEELVGETPRILQGPETDRDVLDRLRESLERGEAFTGETVNYRKDGSAYVVRWTLTPVTDEDGEVRRFVGVQRDVTDERRARDRLEAAVRERTAELRRARSEVLERLARAAEYRDDQTGQHTRRVGAMAARLGRALDMPRERVTLLEQTAPLHDLGKIGIPDDVLLKPGSLDDREWEVMKRHTVIGADLLSGGSSDLARTAEYIARYHHERWDGAGYPEGLEGEEIPLEARIVSVVDTFDALVHERPYKEPWPPEDALAEIRDGAGERYDPRVVRAFLEMSDDLARMLEEGPGALELD
jgi:putative two-component system response regulator